MVGRNIDVFYNKEHNKVFAVSIKSIYFHLFILALLREMNEPSASDPLASEPGPPAYLRGLIVRSCLASEKEITREMLIPPSSSLALRATPIMGLSLHLGNSGS